MDHKQHNSNGQQKKFIRDSERFIDISGPSIGRHPKAHVLVRYYEQFADGTTRDLDMVTMDKPIVKVFSHAGFVNIDLDFGSADDIDLRLLYALLERYRDPANSVSYLPEELESGFYDIGNGETRMVYYPVIALVLSPIGRETEYQIINFNPLDYHLTPGILNGEPSVVRFTFLEDDVHVVNEMDPVDVSGIYHEAVEEVKMEVEKGKPSNGEIE